MAKFLKSERVLRVFSENKSGIHCEEIGGQGLWILLAIGVEPVTDQNDEALNDRGFLQPGRNVFFREQTRGHGEGSDGKKLLTDGLQEGRTFVAFQDDRNQFLLVMKVIENMG